MGIAAAASVVALMTATTTALAQESSERGYPYLRQHVRAPANTFEVGVDTGYVQGFGPLAGTRRIGDIEGPGANIGLSLGWRATPLVSVSWRGTVEQYAQRGEPSGTSVRGLTTSIQTDFHLAPFMRLDPWVGIGTGYRRIMISPPGMPGGVLQGLEFAKLQAGFDLRPREDISIGPMVGADLDLFISDRPIGTTATTSIPDKRFSTYVYAGVKGRFDVLGSRRASPTAYELGKR
jgi:hypothetical protein